MRVTIGMTWTATTLASLIAKLHLRTMCPRIITRCEVMLGDEEEVMDKAEEEVVDEAEEEVVDKEEKGQTVVGVAVTALVVAIMVVDADEVEVDIISTLRTAMKTPTMVDWMVFLLSPQLSQLALGPQMGLLQHANVIFLNYIFPQTWLILMCSSQMRILRST